MFRAFRAPAVANRLRRGPSLRVEDLEGRTVPAATLSATLVGTEIADATNANNEAVVGEIVTYRVSVTVSEGTTPGVVLTDALDPQLAFVGVVSATLPPGVTVSGSLTPTVTNGGRNLSWSLGNAVNTDTDAGVTEVIEFVYTAVVANTADTSAGDLANNGVRLTYTGRGNALTAAAGYVTVIEPRVRVAKSVTVDGSPLGDNAVGDDGDPFTYTVVLSNPSGASQFTADAFDLTVRDLMSAGLPGSPLMVSTFAVTDSAGLVTAANFELVTDAGTGRLVLQTTAGGVFDLPVSDTRTITIQILGTVTTFVAPGQVIPNVAEVRWTSLDGDPGQRSPFTAASTERTGAGGVNDSLADDGASITVRSLLLTKSVVSTSENATTDPTAVVVGEVVRYRVQVAIPDFGTPTPFQFVDLLPAGMLLVGDANGRVALVSNAGDALLSTTLMDPPLTGLYLSGNQSNVAGLVPVAVVPGSVLSTVVVGGRQQVTFDLGLVTNPATPGVNDFEYLIVEFNALVTNTAGNQAGANLTNQVTTVQAGVPTQTIFSTALRVAEPSITNLTKEVVQPVGPTAVLTPDAAAHDAGDTVHYAVSYSNGVGADVSTAYDVRLVDALPAAKVQLLPGSVRVFRNGVEIFTGFTATTTGNTLNVVLDQVAPGEAIVVAYDAVLTTGVVPGEAVPNTADLTYTSLPGDNGTTTNPTGSANTGTPGSDTGERAGDDGAGGALNDHAGTSAAAVAILSPEFDKSILSTSIAATGSDRFDPALPDLTIGETVTYRLTITLPEGTTTLNLTSVLPALSNGTVVLRSAGVTAIGGNISGSALAVGAPGTVSGSTVTFDFGTVVNSPDGIDSVLDQIVVEVVGQVTDLAENVAGVQVTNVATLDYGLGTITDTGVADLVEPVLDVQKGVTPGAGDAGDEFLYTVTVSHLPGSTAATTGYTVTDLLNAGNLELVVGSVTVPAGLTVSSGNTAGDTTVAVIGAALLVGDTVTITYRARLAAAAVPGSTVPNTATLDYTSVPVALGGRAYSDSDPAAVTVFANSIAGVVYRDLNNNGSYEPGLGETLVTDSTTFELTGTEAVGGVAVTRTITTTTGMYVFDLLRPGTYGVRQVGQPAGLLDGRDTPDTPFGGTGTAAAVARTPRDGETITSIVIGAGGDKAGTGYNFGEIPPAAVGDFVWEDTNGNGRQDAGEPGLAGLTVTLSGTDDTGTAVSRSTPTDGSGGYGFTGLRPGTYRATFAAAAGHVFAVQNSPVATNADDSDADAAGQAAFALAPGETNVTIDAGQYVPVSVGGFVYHDLNVNGRRDPGEPGIPGVAVTVSGVLFPGTPQERPLTAADVPGGVLTAGTDATGRWDFSALPPGTYSFVEAQPGAFADGQEENADPNGPGAVVVGNDRFDNVGPGPAPTRGPLNFGELVRATPVPPVPPFPPPPVSTPDFAAFGAPTLRAYGFAAVAQDTGGLVRVFDFASGNERFRFQPYADFTGGVRVAVADVTRDGIPDLITVPGPGGGPVVRVFDGDTGALARTILAFDPAFRGGLYVAAADFNGDFVPDVVVTPDAGGGPVVRVYDGRTGELLSNFLALEESFRGGLRAAAGDVNADGTPDLLVVAGTGGGPRVAGYDGTTLLSGPPTKLFSDFFGFAPELRSGFWITAGDVNGDGLADVLLGAGDGGAPRVVTYSGQALAAGGGPVSLGSFFAGDPDTRSGVRIALSDLDADGRPELLAAPSMGSPPVASVFDPATGSLRDEFYAFPPDYPGGVFVG